MKQRRKNAQASATPPFTGGIKGGALQSAPRRNLENALGNLLRGGVLTAAAVVLLGGIYFLIAHGTERPDYHIFNGDDRAVTTFRGVFGGLFAFAPRGVIQFGILLLIATPVARVLFALFAFLRERDRKFTLITLLVLVFLLYGYLGGKV